MIRQMTVLVLVLTVNLSCCGQKQVESEDRILSSISLQVDTSVITVLPLDTAECWVFKDCKPAELTIGDMTQIEELLRKCIDNYNPVQEREFNEIKAKRPGIGINKRDFIIDLKRYKRQYVAVTNSKGEKEVWVNCFCSTSINYWRKEIVFVFDGGNCYFNLKVNLTTGEYYELMVNGDV